MTKIVDTATAMLVALKDGPMLAKPFRERVEELGGTRLYIPDAAKYLRNQGVPIVSTKARHRSQWSLDPDAADSDDWAERVSKEAYSEAVSTARALALSSDRKVQKVRNRVVGNAINLGVDLGKSPAEVLAECEPVAA